jgi:hypothetical protein
LSGIIYLAIAASLELSGGSKPLNPIFYLGFLNQPIE